jgi:hypothetical protein
VPCLSQGCRDAKPFTIFGPIGFLIRGKLTEERKNISTMAAIGSLVFCTDCGNLLEETEGKADAVLKCDVCGALNKGIKL